MTNAISRRALLALSAGAAAGLGLSACAVKSPTTGGGSGGLRMTWWGGEGENKAINAALDTYSKAKDGTITRESLPWEGYWEKLATTTAAKNAPDIVMQAGSQIPDYAGRKTLLDLRTVTGLKTDAVDEGLQSFGAVGDELFGVVAAANAYGITVNGALAEKAGISMPTAAYSWDDLATLARTAHDTLGGKIRGLSDSSGDLISFILKIRAEGSELYADDGTINPLETQLADWLNFWKTLRGEGVIPTPEENAESAGTLQTSGLAKQTVVMGTQWTQDFVNIAGITDTDWSIHLPPASAEHRSLWMNAASLWSISSTSASVERAGELINYLLTDPAAISAIGVALGSPPTQAARTQLADTVTGAAKDALTYMDLVAQNSTPLNRLWPKGFASSRSQLSELAEAVAFDKQSVDEAVTAFFEQARKA